MKIIDRYIALQFVVGTVPVAALLLILFNFIALAEELEDVGNGLFTTADAVQVVVYTSPRRLVDLLPVTLLLGGLFGLGAMANRRELTAARAGGLSRLRLARPVLLVSLAAAAAAVAAQSLVVPAAEREANVLRARQLAGTELNASGDADFWTRRGDHIVHVGEVRFGRLLRDIEIYSADASGRLLTVVEARHADISGINDWLLRDVRLTILRGQSATETFRETEVWPGLLSAEQAAILTLPLEALAPLDLLRLIRLQRANGVDPQPYRLVLWQQVGTVIAVIGMGLLSLPLLLGSERVVSAGQRIVTGGLIGMVFFLLQQISGHLAALFGLSPPFMHLAPALVLLATALYLQFFDAVRSGRARS